MKLAMYISSIALILFLFSPFVLADEHTHTLGGKLAPSLNEEEVTTWISDEVTIWTAAAVEQLNAVAPNLQLVSEDFQFNIAQSVEQFVDKANVPWYAFWKRQQEVHQPLTVTLSERLIAALDADPSIDMIQTTNDLQLKASVLSPEPLQLVSSNISIADMERAGFINVQTSLPAAELTAAVELLNEKVLQPQEVFSLNETLLQGSSPISEETANFVASMIYITVLQTEFELIERHSQGIVPSYSTVGLEAMVSQKIGRDFQFKNTFESPVTIEASNSGGVFLFEFYTLGADSSATYEVGSREEIQPKRLERLVADLAYGQERQIETGRSGWRVITYRTISSTTGSFETQEVVARDYYPPVNDVFEVSTQPPPEQAVVPGDGQAPGDGTTVDGTTPGTDATTPGTDGSSGDGTTGNETDSGEGTGTGSGNGSTGGNGTGSNSGEGTGTDNGEEFDKGGNKID